MAKMGRPRKEIDKADFEGLLAIGAEVDEVLVFLTHKMGDTLARSTLHLWIKREYGENESFKTLKDKMGVPMQKLKVRQGLMSMVGKNAAVTIFVAKNILGFTDKVEQVVTTETDRTINITFTKPKEE